MKYSISLLTLTAIISISFIACSNKSSSPVTYNSSVDKAPKEVSMATASEYSDPSAEVLTSPSEVAPVVAPVPAPMAVPVSGVKRVYSSSDSVMMPHPPMPVPVPPKREPHAVQSGVLTAGDIDDNLNLSYFQGYVNRILQSKNENIFPFMPTKDRIKLTVLGKDGKGMNHLKVKVGGFEGYTNTQGVLYLFPSVDDIQKKTHLTINKKSQSIDLQSKKEFTITVNNNATLAKRLDLMFVIDSTGSMGDEMRYLSKEFDDIVSNIEEKHPDVDIRFGLTLYRDKGDDYVIRDFPFTSNASKMKKQLLKQSANGGGDYPEAMEQGISNALDASWSSDGVQMMFLVADAPPHDDKIKELLPLIKKAREKGVRIYPIGASGVAQKAEYMMRHLALFTQGRYLWLTDDSGVGNSHAEPKVKCYQVTRLDQLIKRVIDSELSGERVEPKQEDVIRSVGNYSHGVCR